ncbi:NAD(P)/FAD-dependent oxidoreductase [Shinella daejeonensis]|uniref:NAD(P)/FAD-dependent oxidoreductase n=1 Tax=Shinella daejeonensis TaxID=659017 RepID=UPI0020C7B76D|nr:FAD-dependent oxidoreductase [Shinella daejeonensis]MCP8897471.1 NAD(P)/FAD-dependent oxidoreductase [Shinella daejeonensis]
MSSRKIVIAGASDAGFKIALAAHAAGHDVTLVDEHPQALKDMSFDAPWFYGAGLPSALMNDNSIAQSVLEASPQLMECIEAGIDVRVSTVLWGAFRNGPNCLHVGRPKVGLVTREGNEILEHDALIIATGVRDFVPSFKGWELPGVLGGKAGLALLDLYQVFEGKRVVVLGSDELALRVVRSARERGVEVAGIVEPGESVVAGPEAAAWLAAQDIPVHLGQVIAEAIGKTAVTGVKLVSLDNRPSEEIACDTVAVAIATLPNIELPAAMGCEMHYVADAASWIPRTTAQGETSLEGVFWLSDAGGGNGDLHTAILDRIGGAERDSRVTAAPSRKVSATGYITSWIDALHKTGGDDVVLCQCETVSRAEFCGLAPPQYLGKSLRHPQTPLNHGDDATAPRINQDFMKRMTRVSMGHCQGKRCRDEAIFALSLRFGIGLESIRPASYRFPLRPIDLTLIADDDETDDIRLNWQMWPYETRQG